MCVEQERQYELGNLMFGNSRGIYPVERGRYEDKFCEILDYLDMSYHAIMGHESINATDRGGFENDTFLLNPYYWGDDEEIAEEPNFVYKPKEYELCFYKYPLRDAWANKDFSYREFEEMIDDCIKSIG